jgi:hypothetical protein
MFNYSEWAPPPRRRNRGGTRTAIVIVALCALAGVLIVVRPWQTRATAGPQPTASGASGQAGPPVTSAGGLSEGACIDATTSTVSLFSSDIRSDLASAVASLAPAGALPTQPQGPGPLSEPQPALSLQIRQVNNYSNSTEPTAFEQTVNVPAVLGLAQYQPAPGATDYTTQMGAWSALYERVDASREAASKAAKKAAQVIANLPLDNSPQVWSAISACITGLLGTVPATGTRSFLIASDLQEDLAPQLGGSFHGAPLVIIQACDSGNVSYCSGLLSAFEREMHQLHVGPITVIRPEDASQAIYQWVHGEDVTS